MSIAGGLEDCPPHFPNRHRGLGFLGIPGPAVAQDSKTVLEPQPQQQSPPDPWGGGRWRPLLSFICSLGTPITDGLSLLTLAYQEAPLNAW